MLTRRLAGALLALALTAASLVLGAVSLAGPAQAEGCQPVTYDPVTGTYSCTHPGGGGEPGEPGTPGGSTEPTCTLFADYTFCNGTKACKTFDWHPPFVLPDGKKPSPDAKPMVRQCETPLGGFEQTIYWSGEEPEPPSLAEQAQTAIGQLDLALPALLTSPPGRTLVNLPTWFWLDGDQREATGSSAFGLVAIATVQELRVDPGDGSGAITCPWTTSAQEAEQSCSTTYTRPSYAGSASYDGKPAFAATAAATWSLRFEINGTPVTIPGVQTTIDGPTSTTPVRVEQTESLVTESR